MPQAMLIASGADVNLRDWEEFTPLHNAAYNGHVGVAEILIDAGADAEATSYDGQTPYTCAVKKGHKAVMALLKPQMATY